MSISCTLIDINGVEDDRDFPFTVSDLITTCKEVGPMSADERTSVLGRLLYANSVIHAAELVDMVAIYLGMELSDHATEVLEMIRDEAQTPHGEDGELPD
ncbi:MAG: hypothetical protein EB020_04105 [Proteobacteria bacterium]|jgi:hypothetical protein|nr:hypothetical protein [Pseudomonadota bacterium]NBT93706.1 hypothetical protein [Chloroflexota bacterium]NCV01308.1 hypothetical protein [Pseudomonadota bacterium]NCV22672.1 hypothetical protein [Chloroflexota bacterium]NDB20042.1 hypothetical protein [Pseudomonadota bacterium]